MRSPVVTRALFQCVQFSLRVELPLDCKRRRISWLRLSCPFYKVNDIVVNQGFFNVIPLLNEPEGWASQSIWYENRGVLGIQIRTSFIPIFMAVV